MEDNELLQAIRAMLKEELEPIKAQLDEHTQILKVLEHKADINKAEHDKMINDIAHIHGDIEGLKKDLANVEIITSSNWNDIAKLKANK